MTTDLTGAPRLELSGVTLPGISPIDLAMHAGELVAVTGWDSSDLLWVVAGLIRSESGSVAIDGRPVSDHADASARGLALIPQGGALASLLTAYEDVLLPLLRHPQVPGKWARTTATRRVNLSPEPTFAGGSADSGGPAEQARRALEQVGLGESLNHLVEELSGGQQQRVAIARALAGRPRLLLADQVTTDLDPGNRVRVLGLLRDLAASGAAVLLASDDSAVIEACDSVVML